MVDRNRHGVTAWGAIRATGRAKVWLWAAAAAALTCAVVVSGQVLNPMRILGGGLVARRPMGIDQPASPGGTTLVPIDSEFQRALVNAKRYIAQGQFDSAAEVLQSLLSRQDAGFVATEERGRYGAMARRVNEALASMGEAGLARYRLLYDSKAAAMLRQAVDQNDAKLLGQVAREYLHTASGATALEALGDLRFDQGRFDAAQRTWQEAAEAGGESARPGRLCKRVVALRLAGQDAQAKALADEIGKRYPDATVKMGGREWKLPEFLALAGTLSPPATRASAAQAQGDWLGTGKGQSLVRMSDCNVVPNPQWQVTEPAPVLPTPPAEIPALPAVNHVAVPAVQGFMVVDQQVGLVPAPGMAPEKPAPVTAAEMVSLMAMRPWLQRPVGGPYTIHAIRKGGHVVLRWQVRTGPNYDGGYMPQNIPDQPLVAAIDPVVVGDLLICRRDDGVAAYDLTGARTGEPGAKVWASLPLPVAEANNWRNSPEYWYADPSSYGITSDGQRAFVIGSMPRPPQAPATRPGNAEAEELERQRVARRMGMGGSLKAQEESLALVALSLEQEGKVLWSVGGGTGEESIQRARFSSPPAVSGDRLYAAAVINDTVYLVCLDLGGTVLWKTPVCELPAGNPAVRQYRASFGVAGASIALADGMVYVCTNTGVLACVDAESGQAQWARQYIDGEAALARSRGAYDPSPGRISGGLNPLLVVEGMVIALPGDWQALVAVSAVDGQLLWTKPTPGQMELSVIDSRRVLLSSPGLIVVDTSNGATVFGQADLGLRGRPAVGEKAVIASGQGQLVRMDLKDYTITRTNLGSPEAMLGNLVAVGGRLVAANASGLYVYLSYDDRRAELDRRLGGQQGPARGKVLLDRGKLSCQAGRYDEALSDLKPALELAGPAGPLNDETHEWLMRTYVARGDRREKPADMAQDFQLAYDVAGTPARQAQMLVRLGKAHHQAAAAGGPGDEASKTAHLNQAIEAAHRLADSLGGEKVASVPVGAKALSQPPESLPLTDARTWAMTSFLPALMKVHGRGCYAAWDARADEALANALASDDVAAMLAVRDRWPNSLHVPRALIAAAGSMYRRQAAAATPDEQELERAYALLADAEPQADPRMAVTSLAGRAMIVLRRGGPGPLTWILAQQIRQACQAANIPLSEPAAFNQVDKPLQGFLDELSNLAPGPAASSEPETPMPAPVEQALTLKGDYYLVRDQASQAVRQGANVLAIHDDRLVWLDTAATDPGKALRWEAASPVNSKDIRSANGASAFTMVGGLSADGKSVVVAGRMSAMAYNLADGAPLWKGPVNLSALTNGAVHSLGIADGRLVVLDHNGRARCLDAVDGKVVWTSDLSGDLARFGEAPPQIAEGLVLLQSSSAQKLACLDLRTGKKRGLWSSAMGVSAEALPGGLLAVMADGSLSLYPTQAPAPLGRPIWTRAYKANLQPAIVGADRSRIFVSDSMASPSLEVIGLDNKPLQSVKISGRVRGSICAVQPVGESLYLAVGNNIQGRRNGLYMGHQIISPMSLYRVGATTGREIWKDVAPLAGGPGAADFPIFQAGPTVVVSVGSAAYGNGMSVSLLGTTDGKRVQTITLAGPPQPQPNPQPAQGQDGGDSAPRRQSLGPALVIDGRLCAEDLTGLTVYRPKPAPATPKP